MANKASDPKPPVSGTRELLKTDKVTIGKYYQIGEKHSLKADKVYRIETNDVVMEHDKEETLTKKIK